MRDAELSACWTAACSMSAYASRCRFRASGVEGAGMARSSVAAAMSLWLARGGVSGSSTLKSVLMRKRQGSDHPPVLEPHMVLNLPLDECIENTHKK
jgi:hypothetical protein